MAKYSYGMPPMEQKSSDIYFSPPKLKEPHGRESEKDVKSRRKGWSVVKLFCQH